MTKKKIFITGLAMLGAATIAASQVMASDSDADGISDEWDNCPAVANADQADSNDNRIGDACEADTDGDGIYDVDDSCPNHVNTGTDTDLDNIDEACDNCVGYACDGACVTDSQCASGFLCGCPSIDQVNCSSAGLCVPDWDLDGKPNSSDSCPKNVGC